MKILVMSDSHGKNQYAYTAVYENKDSDVIIHLGDGENDLDVALRNIQGLSVQKVIRVRGNCDFYSDLPITAFENIGGYRFYITHGYIQHVKSGTSGLLAEVKKNNMEIALFGHTHRAYYEQIGGVHLFNPGAMGHGEYGVIELPDDGTAVTFRHCSI